MAGRYPPLTWGQNNPDNRIKWQYSYYAILGFVYWTQNVDWNNVCAVRCFVIVKWGGSQINSGCLFNLFGGIWGNCSFDLQKAAKKLQKPLDLELTPGSTVVIRKKLRKWYSARRDLCRRSCRWKWVLRSMTPYFWECLKWSMVLTVYRVHTVRKDGSIGTEDTVDR